jgi:hypothetical protein
MAHNGGAIQIQRRSADLDEGADRNALIQLHAQAVFGYVAAPSQDVIALPVEVLPGDEHQAGVAYSRMLSIF